MSSAFGFKPVLISQVCLSNTLIGAKIRLDNKNIYSTCTVFQSIQFSMSTIMERYVNEMDKTFYLSLSRSLESQTC